jgi:rhodanese-related sulfurtransferase
MKTITAQDLKNRLDSGEDTVLVNTLSNEYFQQQHIPGSINIPTEEIESRAEKELLRKDQDIVVYCASPTCQASPAAARKLEEMGYTNVYEYSGGLQGWDEAGYPFAGTETE